MSCKLECSLCKDSVKEHFIEHVNLSKETETNESLTEDIKPKYKTLFDKYDNDGN